jgi:hypothetical protein
MDPETSQRDEKGQGKTKEELAMALGRPRKGCETI